MQSLANGGLDPDLFCVTDDMNAARAFYARGTGGTIVLHNAQTKGLSEKLNILNRERADYDYETVTAPELTQEAADLVGTIVGTEEIRAWATKPHRALGWYDAPHTHKYWVGLLTGSERPTEISNGPLVPFSEYAKFCETEEEFVARETEWGNEEGREEDPAFAQRAPITFLPGALVINAVNHAAETGVLHRIPRRLRPDEQRGFILMIKPRLGG